MANERKYCTSGKEPLSRYRLGPFAELLLSVTLTPAILLGISMTAPAKVEADEFCRPEFQYVEDSHGHGCRKYTNRDSFVREGRWKTFYDSGALKSEGAWKNDLRHGLWKHYFPGGSLKEETNYRDGIRQGGTKIRNRRGVVIAEGAFINDRKSGEWREWYDNGSLKEVIRYGQPGKPEGISWNYYPNRQPAVETEWKNGLQEGVVKKFDEHGRLLELIEYRQGVPHGFQRKWYAEDQLEEEASYRHGEREGKRTVWYRDNVKKFEGNYKNGALDGEVRFWDHGGELRYILLYRRGVFNRVLDGAVNYQKDKLRNQLIAVEP